MELTHREERTARRLLAWHRQPPTWPRLLRHAARRIVVWAVVFGLAAWSVHGSRPELSDVLCGIFTGFVGCNAALLCRHHDTWRVYEHMVDWSRVEALLPPGAPSGAA